MHRITTGFSIYVRQYSSQPPRLFQLLFLCAVFTCVFSACSSRKKLVSAGAPPARSVASRYAEMMEVDPSDIRNGKLYRFIDEWYGTRYRLGGMDKGGVDCSAFTLMLERDVYGKTLPRVTGQQADAIKRKYEDQLEEGDLVFFDYDGRRFSHVGVYLQNGYFVHASELKGVIITRLRDPWTYKYFSRAGAVN